MENNPIYLIVSTIFVPIVTAVLPKLLENKKSDSSKQGLVNVSSNSNNTIKINSDNTINQSITIHGSSTSSNSNEDLILALVGAFIVVITYLRFNALINIVYPLLMIVLITIYILFVNKKYQSLSYKQMTYFFIVVSTTYLISFFLSSEYINQLQFTSFDEYIPAIWNLFLSNKIFIIMFILVNIYCLVFPIVIMIINYKKHIFRKSNLEPIYSDWKDATRIYIIFFCIFLVIAFIFYLFNNSH